MMSNNDKKIQLHGRVFIRGIIVAKTGLHIGGAENEISIGGVDNTVVRDPLTQRPYIPGSSLKGKMRSLTEKIKDRPQNQKIGKDVWIHLCQELADYETCPVCQIFGTIGITDGKNENLTSKPTRLVVRDVALDENSVKELEKAKTDLPFTEVKWEVAIDRVTSAATPRQLERVPAGAEFGPFELVYNIYEAGDLERFRYLIDSLSLLEDDYLGGSGSRGSGKMDFVNLNISYKHSENYREHFTLYPLLETETPYPYDEKEWEKPKESEKKPYTYKGAKLTSLVQALPDIQKNLIEIFFPTKP